MSEPNYIVIRDPENERVSGRWYDLADADAFAGGVPDAVNCVAVTYVPTGFIEVRQDGAVAQVYMRRQP